FVIVGIGIMLALAFARLHLAAPDMADRGSGPPPQLLGCLAPYDIPAGTIVTVARWPVGPAQDAGPSGHKMLAWDGPPAGVRKIPRERRLVETAGGTFLLPAGVDVEIRRPGFAPAILSAREPVRFAAADPATTYVLQVAGPEPADGDDAVKAAQEGRADLVLPGQDRANAGAGLGEVRPGVVLKTLQPLSVQPWTGGATQQLEPSRLRAGGGFDRIDVQVQQSGTNFNGPGVSFTGCASVDARTHSLSVAQVSNQAVGSATVTLAMPRDILPSGIATLRSTISFVVASSDGRYVGAGSFVAFNPLVSGLVATPSRPACSPSRHRCATPVCARGAQGGSPGAAGSAGSSSARTGIPACRSSRSSSGR
ncbi:MAG TPA: hypothetical protein VEA41_07695, partial [Salinarimonas sp.]|nr:hypothetical protein [Salinarimonas sp.]